MESSADPHAAYAGSIVDSLEMWRGEERRRESGESGEIGEIGSLKTAFHGGLFAYSYTASSSFAARPFRFIFFLRLTLFVFST